MLRVCSSGLRSQVGQLAKKLGILSNGAASPTATAAAAAAATTLPVAARQSSPNKAAASDGSPAANAGGELKRSAPPTPAHGPEPEASKKPKLSHAAGTQHASMSSCPDVFRICHL